MVVFTTHQKIESNFPLVFANGLFHLLGDFGRGEERMGFMKSHFYTLVAVCAGVLAWNSGWAVPEPIDILEGSEATSCYNDPVNSQSLPYPFNNVFVLRLSPSIANQWTAANLDSFATNIMDSNPSNRWDVFPRVWDYMCFGDQDPTYEGISVFGGTKLNLYVYHRGDCCPSGCTSSGDPTCRYDAGGFYAPPTPNFYVAGSDCNGAGGPSYTWDSVARGGVWPHELGHLCDYANPTTYRMPTELYAKLSEYSTGLYNQSPSPFSWIYDSPLTTTSPRSGGSDYLLFDMWAAYLFRNPNYIGQAWPNIQDDLAFRWIHHQVGGTGAHDQSTRALGEELLINSYGVPGTTSSERFASLYQRFAIARYADDPTSNGGIYGFGNVSTRSWGIFEWPDHNLPGVLAVPPFITVGAPADNGNVISFTSLENPTDHSTDPLKLWTRGSDYIAFSGDPSYFASLGGDRNLRIRIQGTQSVPSNQTFRLSYILYNSYDGDLWRRSPAHTPTFYQDSVPIVVSGGVLDTEFVIKDFGITNKGVALVFSMLES